MSPGRCLVVTSTFPQYEGDARGAFLRHHWGQRARQGQGVTLLAPRTLESEADFDPGFELRRFAYAPRRLSSLTGRHGILENLRERKRRAALVPGYFAALDRALKKELKTGRYESVAAHFLLPSGLAVARRCAGRIPFELYGHGTDVDLLMRLPAPVRARVGRQLGLADRIFMPSAAKREKAVAAFGWQAIADKIHVEYMRHAIAVDPTNAARVVEGDYLLFLGRLIEQKGVDLLLDAAAASPGVRVVIAGEGPARGALEAQARRLRVDAQFVGWVQGKTKAALIRDALALVVPSRETRGLSEGAPLVIAEANALGRPVIASHVGGIAELAELIGADIALFPSDSSTALAAELRRFAPSRDCLLDAAETLTA